MIIYQDTRAGFLRDVASNSIQPRLEEAFRAKTGSVPADRRGWASDYARLSIALNQARVSDEIDIAIEYHVSPIGRSRIDALVVGSDGERDNGLIIELKAWDRAEVSPVEDMVVSPVGGGTPKQHPLLQAQRYVGSILRFNQDMSREDIRLHSSAYLFNLHRRRPEPLEDPRYARLLEESRLFLADDAAELCAYFERLVPRKAKNDVLFLLEHGKWRPTDELIGRVESMLAGNDEFLLIDEQDEAFRIIRHRVLETTDLNRRHVFVVEGGPGTGKSVIAVRLLAEAMKAKRMVFFVAPNMAFREALVNSLAKGDRKYREDGKSLFQSSWGFSRADYAEDGRNEVLIVDEAHRLKNKAYQYKGESMVEDMVRGARISVFFIDESQQVSWNDMGSIKAIQTAAKKFNAVYHPPLALSSQFRCNGSTGYLNWLDDVLQLRQTGNFENWGDGQYDFRVFDKAEDMYAALKERNSENRARLIAGYSWEWPSKGRERGTRLKHVRADDLALPWNYTGENWATCKDGIEQAGCIHTSQGLEFDWMGVLIGSDLICRDGVVKGDPSKRAKTDKSLHGWKSEFASASGNLEKEQAIRKKVDRIIKSTYRVLLSRGRKGCFIWCEDRELRDYLRRRLVLATGQGSST